MALRRWHGPPTHRPNPVPSGGYSAQKLEWDPGRHIPGGARAPWDTQHREAHVRQRHGPARQAPSWHTHTCTQSRRVKRSKRSPRECTAAGNSHQHWAGLVIGSPITQSPVTVVPPRPQGPVWAQTQCMGSGRRGGNLMNIRPHRNTRASTHRQMHMQWLERRMAQPLTHKRWICMEEGPHPGIYRTPHYTTFSFGPPAVVQQTSGGGRQLQPLRHAAGGGRQQQHIRQAAGSSRS